MSHNVVVLVPTCTIMLHLPGLVPVDFQREFRVSFPIRVHVAAAALVFRPTARDGACEKMKKPFDREY